MKLQLSKFIEEADLTEIQQKVVDYYSDHLLCSRIECCKEIYGDSNIFHLSNLSTIESQIRKKGYMFYTSNGIVIDMSNPDIDVELKLKVQKRMGGSMYGYIRSNIRIFQSATNTIQLDFAKLQFKEALQDLVDGEYIKVGGINLTKLQLTAPEKLLKQNETIQKTYKRRSSIHS